MSTPTYKATVKAMGVRNEHPWHLADALLAEVPANATNKLFDQVATAVRDAGLKPLGISAMRQYRDTAWHWNGAKYTRIPGVSFTCHRLALASANPEGLLRSLAAQHGAENVTVSMVREAVAIEHGRTVVKQPKAGTVTNPAPTVQTTPTVAGSWLDLLVLLTNGPKGDRDEAVRTPEVDMDLLHIAVDGLFQAVTAERDSRNKAKAPRKVTSVKARAPKAPAKAKPAPAAKPEGEVDIRDL